MPVETLQDNEQRARRRELRQIPSELLRQLLAEYRDYADDQPLNEKYVAARLAKSRAWCQLRRVTGGGPRFHRTVTGKIYYKKADIEAYLAASLTSYGSTAEYPTRVAQGGAQ